MFFAHVLAGTYSSVTACQKPLTCLFTLQPLSPSVFTLLVQCLYPCHVATYVHPCYMPPVLLAISIPCILIPPNPSPAVAPAISSRGQLPRYRGSHLWLDRVSELLAQTGRAPACYPPTKRVSETDAPPPHPSALSFHYGLVMINIGCAILWINALLNGPRDSTQSCMLFSLSLSRPGPPKRAA